MSWGNFDFDPEYYPSPEQFIANLSAYGFDLQVDSYLKMIQNFWLIEPGLGCESCIFRHRAL